MSGRPRSPRLMALCKSPRVTRSTSPGGPAGVDGRTRRRRDHPGAHPNPRPVAHRCRQKAVPRSIRPATSRYSCLKSSRIPITNVMIASRAIASGDATVAAAKLDPFLHRAALRRHRRSILSGCGHARSCPTRCPRRPRISRLARPEPPGRHQHLPDLPEAVRRHQTAGQRPPIALIRVPMHRRGQPPG
jgi:hypothetical protein